MKNKTLLYWNSFKKNIEEVAFNKVLDLNLLYGLDQQKDLIQENTKNFIDGLSYNHALLWGVRGSGKSSLVRGIVQKFASEYDNFITLEVNSDDISDLSNIFINFEFKKNIILFIDDLSFEQNDRRYIQFKSFLEGSFSNSKYNFLVYVTSNRRHLMKRDMIKFKLTIKFPAIKLKGSKIIKKFMMYLKLRYFGKYVIIILINLSYFNLFLC